MIKRDLRHRFFLEGDLDFIDNTIENSPAEEASMYFHLMWSLLLWTKSKIKTKPHVVGVL